MKRKDDSMKKIFLTVLMLMTFILSGCGGQVKDEYNEETPPPEANE